MKKILLIIMIMAMSTFVYGDTVLNYLSKGYADSLYCHIDGTNCMIAANNDSLWANISGTTTSAQSTVQIDGYLRVIDNSASNDVATIVLESQGKEPIKAYASGRLKTRYLNVSYDTVGLGNIFTIRDEQDNTNAVTFYDDGDNEFFTLRGADFIIINDTGGNTIFYVDVSDPSTDFYMPIDMHNHSIYQVDEIHAHNVTGNSPLNLVLDGQTTLTLNPNGSHTWYSYDLQEIDWGGYAMKNLGDTTMAGQIIMSGYNFLDADAIDGQDITLIKRSDAETGDSYSYVDSGSSPMRFISHYQPFSWGNQTGIESWDASGTHFNQWMNLTPTGLYVNVPLYFGESNVSISGYVPYSGATSNLDLGSLYLYAKHGYLNTTYTEKLTEIYAGGGIQFSATAYNFTDGGNVIINSNTGDAGQFVFKDINGDVVFICDAEDSSCEMWNGFKFVIGQTEFALWFNSSSNTAIFDGNGLDGNERIPAQFTNNVSFDQYVSIGGVKRNSWPTASGGVDNGSDITMRQINASDFIQRKNGTSFLRMTEKTFAGQSMPTLQGLGFLGLLEGVTIDEDLLVSGATPSIVLYNDAFSSSAIGISYDPVTDIVYYAQNAAAGNFQSETNFGTVGQNFNFGWRTATAGNNVTMDAARKQVQLNNIRMNIDVGQNGPLALNVSGDTGGPFAGRPTTLQVQGKSCLDSAGACESMTINYPAIIGDSAGGQPYLGIFDATVLSDPDKMAYFGMEGSDFTLYNYECYDSTCNGSIEFWTGSDQNTVDFTVNDTGVFSGGRVCDDNDVCIDNVLEKCPIDEIKVTDSSGGTDHQYANNRYGSNGGYWYQTYANYKQYYTVEIPRGCKATNATFYGTASIGIWGFTGDINTATTSELSPPSGVTGTTWDFNDVSYSATNYMVFEFNASSSAHQFYGGKVEFTDT